MTLGAKPDIEAVRELFNAFDADKSGYLDKAEMAGGLALMCGGTPEERAKFAMTNYDTSGDGMMSKSELEEYFASVFRVLFVLEPGKPLNARLNIFSDTHLRAPRRHARPPSAALARPG